jgi:AraC-like DNA-binding protein
VVRASDQRNEMDRTLFCTSDPDRSGAYLASMYGTGMRMGRPSAGHATFRHERRTASRLCLDRVALPMTVAVDVEPLDRILVQEVLDGCLSVRFGHGDTDYPVGSVMVPAPPGLPYHTDVKNIFTDITVLDLGFLRAVAGLDHRDGAAPLRLLRPREAASPTHTALWRVARQDAWRLLDDTGVPAAPLVLDAAARVLAAVTLTAFPNNYAAADPLQAGPGHVGAETVRRAVEFIDAHADRPITLGDIASAAGVSARALQYGFRHHHDTTPMAYLRRVRLERAHHDLRRAQAGDGETVAVVAARWGWATPRAFSTVYRQVYGTSPAQALRAPSRPA